MQALVKLLKRSNVQLACVKMFICLKRWLRAFTKFSEVSNPPSSPLLPHGQGLLGKTGEQTTTAFCTSRRVVCATGMWEVGVEEDHIEIPEGKNWPPHFVNTQCVTWLFLFSWYGIFSYFVNNLPKIIWKIIMQFHYIWNWKETTEEGWRSIY